MAISTSFQQMSSQIIITQQKPSKTTHHISPNPIPMKIKGERIPLVDTHFTTPKMLSFRDLEQKWAPKVEALFGASMENEGERKATQMVTPPSSPPPPPPTGAASQSPSTLKRIRKATRLRSLATRPIGAQRPLVHVDPATGKADSPHRKKLRTYLGIVARDKVDVTYENWKQHLIWGQKRKYFRLWGSGGGNLSLISCRNGHLQSTRKVAMTLYAKSMTFSKDKWAQFCYTRRDPSWEDVRKKAQAIQSQNKLMDEKRKKKLEETAQSGSTDTVIDPPSPIRRHVKWKMTRTKKTGQMSIRWRSRPHRVPLSPMDVRITPWSCACCWSRCHNQAILWISSKDLPPGLVLPPEPEVGPSTARVSIKESCVDPSGNDPNTGDSGKYGLYIEENPPCLVALGRLYEGSTIVHNIPLLHDQVKVGVEEVRDADAPIPVPTEEVKLVGQTLNTFLAWPTHLVKRLSEQGAVGPVKPVDRPDHDIDDPLYLMTLTIPQLFLKPLHMTETSMRVRNADVYGFLGPQFIQRFGQSQFESESYIKNWMQNSKRDVYLGAYLNGPDNYLNGIINSALKGLDDTPQSKSKAAARWIIVKYFNDARPLEPERLKALRIQWAKYYLKLELSYTPPIIAKLTPMTKYMKILKKSLLQRLLVATYPSAGRRRVTRGMRVPRKEYARSRHQRLFEENVGKTGKDAIYELLSERFGSCIYARGSKIGEVVAAQLAQASSARPGEQGCFLQKQPPSGGIFWRAQMGLGAICTPIFTKYTPLCCFLQKNVYTDNHSGISAYHRARRLWMIQGCRMTKLGLCLSSGPPPLDDKRVRITIRMTKLGLCLSSGPPPLDDKRVRITIRMTKLGLCLSSGPPPLDDKRVRITIRMTKLGLCLSSGPPPLDDKRVRITVRMTKLGLCLSSGPPPLDDKRVRITIRMTKLGLCLSSGPPPLDDKRVRITIRYLRVSSGPPPLDDTRSPTVATYPSAGGRRVTRGMRVPRKEYARSRHQRLFEENVGKTGKDAIYELLSERFGSWCFPLLLRIPQFGMRKSDLRSSFGTKCLVKLFLSFLQNMFFIEQKLLINSIKNEKSQRENVRLIFRFILLKDVFFIIILFLPLFLISNVVTARPNERRRTVETFARFITENVTETFRKRLGLDFLHGNNFSKQIRKREKCLRGWTPSFFISSPIYSKIGKVVAAQLAQASSARPGEQGCFLQKQPPSGGIFWRAQMGLGAICTPIFTKYTPLCCFLVILFS
ncbi:hypothetical protein HKD37_03G006881 [Glycine soja]